MLDAAEMLDRGGHGLGDAGSVGDVDGDAEDARRGEVLSQGCDGCQGGAECGFQIPDDEARGAVLEEGARGAEAEGSSAARD